MAGKDESEKESPPRSDVSVHELLKNPGLQKKFKKEAIAEARRRVAAGELRPQDIAARHVEFPVPVSRLFGSFVAHSPSGTVLSDVDTDDPVTQFDLDNGSGADGVVITSPGPGHYDLRDSGD